MVMKANIKSDSIFIDLGCGIGNVVLFMASFVGCESFGVELMEAPVQLAQAQVKEFTARMR
jgi:H3 lysine-79-specific histone-lysine N-methyltransferase